MLDAYEVCDLCSGEFIVEDGVITPTSDMVAIDKYYVDVCDECVEKYNIDYLYESLDDLLSQDMHVVGEEFPPPSIN